MDALHLHMHGANGLLAYLVHEKIIFMDINLRRRNLLPLLLKIYLLAGVLVGVLFLCLGAAMVGHAAMPEEYSLADEIMGNVAIGGYFLLSIAYIVKYFLLWFEVKSAIRWNWGIGVCWGIFILVMGIVQDKPEYLLIQLVVSVPYWWMLYRIQDKWEYGAVTNGEQSQSITNR
ncbi:hypothetical protein SIO70_00070 [Chitinophaga sancti]|uniref:hypothetical protein n=1 Tax=Chitinophaga sancti TaxID=1004 RepID=UPI002A759A73|nr:hypothetical protein [Chitinophaga sancti]WPQ63257.1 hypothetical protein SIO70_00070 [Chitinophaga sancti]